MRFFILIKTIRFVFCLFAFAAAAVAQQATEIPVSLKAANGRFVGQVANGGLDVNSESITAKQTFVLVDINGGKVADGDSVKIKMEESLWHEDKEKKTINRVPARAAIETECVFKLRVRGKLIALEAPSGRFVAVDGWSLVTTDDPTKATAFDIQAVAPKSAPTAYTVAFKFANGKFMGMVPQGGMDASADAIGANQTFTMIDLNGNQLSSGDTVRLIFGQSQLREDPSDGRIHRVPIRGSVEAECTFRIIVVGANILLETPKGKYVATATDGKSLTSTEKKDESSLMTAVPTTAPESKK